MDTDYPERITVTKSITYDLTLIANDLEQINGKKPTEDEIIEIVEEYAKDDFSCGWGHQADLKDLIFINADTGDEY